MVDQTPALPAPENWPAGWRRFLRVKAALAVFGVLALLSGLIELDERNYLAAVVPAGFLVSLGLAAFVLVRVTHGGARVRANHDSTGTTLRPDEAFGQMGLLAAAIFIAAGVNCVAGVLLGHVQPDESESQLVAVAGVGTLIVVGGLFAVWRRGGMGHVQLTPGGVAYTDLKHSVAVVSVPWDDMVRIADYVKSSDGPRKTIALRLKDKTRQTIDDADLYAPNGYALYWMVRHYWRHAEDRPELTDGRALERLEAGRFDVTVP